VVTLSNAVSIDFDPDFDSDFDVVDRFCFMKNPEEPKNDRILTKTGELCHFSVIIGQFG